jgi:hypothetical protein
MDNKKIPDLAPVGGTTTTNWTGGWVDLMGGLHSLDNKKFPDIPRN